MPREMLFGEVDDCDICPFYKGNEREYGSEFTCSGDPNQSHPCWFMDEYGDMTLQEVVDAVNSKIYAAEAYYEKQWLAKKAKEERNAELAKKRRQTRSANYSLNREITRLRKLIRDREHAIHSLIALTTAFGMTNAMFEGRNYEDEDGSKNPQVIAWKEANERDSKRLEELIKEREKRNKERRKKS